MLPWIVSFLIAAAVIAWAGWRLIQAVDLIAERTGLGRVFLGMILVATITSLPELATGISAVVIAQAPDIAVGDVIGSCVFNLLLFAVADAASPKLAFYGGLRPSHNLTAAFGVVLLGVLAIAILAPGGARLAIGHVGVYSLLLAGLYFAAAALLYAVDVPAAAVAEDASNSTASGSLRSAIAWCVGAAILVTASGALLAISADIVAERANLGKSFMGVLFVAGATSLPELVATLAAVRLRAFDLAAGGLLGSNLFNMVVLAIDDIAYTEAPLLTAASGVLAISAVVAMVMTAVVVAALGYVRRTAPHAVDHWANSALVGLYLFNAWLMFVAAGHAID